MRPLSSTNSCRRLVLALVLSGYGTARSWLHRGTVEHDSSVSVYFKICGVLITSIHLLQVFPPRAAGSRPPVLLQTLEAQLLEATNAAARSASAGPHQQRDPNIAANLSLDAHRQASLYSSAYLRSSWCCCHSSRQAHMQIVQY